MKVLFMESKSITYLMKTLEIIESWRGAASPHWYCKGCTVQVKSTVLCVQGMGGSVAWKFQELCIATKGIIKKYNLWKFKKFALACDLKPRYSTKC